MADEQKTKLRLEIAHVLFMDIVDYSKLLTDEQSEALQELNQIVRNTEAAHAAAAAGQLTILPTGDGMALVFSGSVEEPVECALEISQALRAQPSLPVRMGIHSGPIHHVKDANERENIAGVGINIAQRVMDCGDAGHILVSKRVADDLAQQRRWQPYLHELGDVEVKHGVVVSLVNLYAETIGNPNPPTRIGNVRGAVRSITTATRKGLSPLARAIFIIVGLLVALTFVLAIVSVIFAPAIMRTLDKRGLVTSPQPSATASPSLADTIKSAVAKKITDELQDELSGKRNAAGEPPPTGSAIPKSEVNAKSVAVLAFANLSDDKGSEYFSDGISEELLTVLQKIPGLRVSARTSAFSFKGKNATAQEIGQKLGVAHLVEGSVRKAGETVRIAARLTKTTSGDEIWSENYTRNLKDVFAVQTELAATIVEQLRGQLTGGGDARAKAAIQGQVQAAEKGGTKNVEAHEAYLQGRFFSNRHSEKETDQARVAYQRAVELDPNFALAWAGLAEIHVWECFYSGELNRITFDKHVADARDAVARALSLEPNLPEALAVRAKMQLGFDFDWKEAAETLRTALALAPTNVGLLISSGNHALAQGDPERATTVYNQAITLDPVNPAARSNLAQNLVVTRHFAEAEAEYPRVVELNPAAPYAHAGLAQAYL